MIHIFSILSMWAHNKTKTKKKLGLIVNENERATLYNTKYVNVCAYINIKPILRNEIRWKKNIFLNFFLNYWKKKPSPSPPSPLPPSFTRTHIYIFIWDARWWACCFLLHHPLYIGIRYVYFGKKMRTLVRKGDERGSEWDREREKKGTKTLNVYVCVYFLANVF